MQPRWQPSLDDYIDMAAYLLRADRAAITGLPRLALAESALHAPFASFGGVEAYPTLVEQAAVLLQHLARNHPLPDANKRAAFLLMARFLDANGLPWGPPDVETDAGLVERAAAGDATLDDIADWIRKRTAEAGDAPSATLAAVRQRVRRRWIHRRSPSPTPSQRSVARSSRRAYPDRPPRPSSPRSSPATKSMLH